MRRMAWAGIFLCLLFCFTGYSANEKPENTAVTESSQTNGEQGEETESPVQKNQSISELYTAETRISDVIADPVFENYGRLIFPVDSSYYSGDTLSDLRLTWYSGIDQEKTVEIVNYMKDHAAAGNTIFFDLYTDEEKAADPAKEDTGLFFFKTVAGTGSEMNGGAVITNEAQKVKTGRDYPECNPAFALLDPTYTYSVPKFQMISGGFDILSHVMETYFSGPDEDNVSDDISESLMRGVIRDLRAAIKNPEDYTARSNLMWESTMGENRIIKLGKQMEHQLGAYTDCNHGAGLAVLHPVYYRHIYKDGLKKFKQFAINVWHISAEGKTDEEIALAGIEALEDFIVEIGLPVTLQDLGVNESTDLKAIADSCNLAPGSYKKMTHEEILKIFRECF